MWRGGCIIAANSSARFASVYKERRPRKFGCWTSISRLPAEESQAGWRETIKRAVTIGVPRPAFPSALCGTTTAIAAVRLPAQLLQAQRDYFGAHTYERVV
jgi:6-phosphogluconate dehydrogenase